MIAGDSLANLNPTHKAVLRRVTRLAKLLDNSIGVPGTRFRIGLDPLLGLIPGLGDFAAAALSTYILDQARRLGAPKTILARMAANVAIDWLIGTIPILGDLFDFGFKCNARNVRLLERWLGQRESPPRQ